mmetsp:Transcript_8666/g.35696  ORF Transcript_8666/g.35696 Transcript_8666/m.35696 type:complete len:149 (+) Transcript_8666:989-1435(+)
MAVAPLGDESRGEVTENVVFRPWHETLEGRRPREIGWFKRSARRVRQGRQGDGSSLVPGARSSEAPPLLLTISCHGILESLSDNNYDRHRLDRFWRRQQGLEEDREVLKSISDAASAERDRLARELNLDLRDDEGDSNISEYVSDEDQ